MYIIWDIELSSETSFDVDFASSMFHWHWHCPFWDMQLEAISLPLKTVSMAVRNNETCLCKDLKTTQVFYITKIDQDINSPSIYYT